MSKDYTHKDVRVLAEIDHIRLNPGMYIGDTSNPVHLIEEALDNALDEALAGHANIVAVFVDTKEKVYKVLDNGRGVPITNDIPVTISSKLFSGAKFQDKKSAYEISSGLHGVGLVAVNALSSYYKIEVYRDGKHGIFEFNKTKLVKKRVKKNGTDEPFSTKIEFKPDKSVFESLDADLDRIRKRLIIAAAEMEGITLILRVDEHEPEIFKMTLPDYFYEYCISNKDEEMIEFASYKKPEKFKILMAYEENGSNAPKVLSSINLLPVDGGGTHVNTFQDMLKDFFMKKAKQLGYSFQPRDCLYGLRAYLSLSLIEPKFAGQTKERLTNRKSEFEKFIKDIRNGLETYAISNPSEINELLERFQSYRKKLESKGLVKSGTGKRVHTKFTKLRDCNSRNGELFIVEGESAGGSIIQARDPKIHAVLPLKGKSIPNATTKKGIIKNKEVEELVKAIGVGVEPHVNLSNIRYDKIICATDADADGSHIACLLTVAIAVLMPDVIKEGRYFLAQTPLFAINEKKSFIPLWTQEELEKARKDKRSISRFKGLGELTPAQLKTCLLEEKVRRLIPVEYSENIDELTKLFSNADEKRKLLGV